MTKVGQGPMLAKLEPEIPRGPGWTYEPKWDGFARSSRSVAGSRSRAEATGR